MSGVHLGAPDRLHHRRGRVRCPVRAVTDDLIWRPVVEQRQLNQTLEKRFDRGLLIGCAPTRRARQAFLDRADHGGIDIFARGGRKLTRQRIRLRGMNFEAHDRS